MDSHTAGWIAGILVPSGIVWAFAMSWGMRAMLQGICKLVAMHEDPGKYGLGTANTEEAIKENTRATVALTHYIKWMAEQTTGKAPPPPVE